MALLNTKLDEIKRQKETYLKPQNIKQGIEVMGIEGNMVDTTAGDALASNIAKGKVAYVGNKEVVGTLDFDIGQVVAGVDEMKKVYENIPNTFECQEYNTPIIDNYSGNESSVRDITTYCDKDYPFFVKAFIYWDYGYSEQNTNDCRINIYDKTFKLIDSHSLLEDIEYDLPRFSEPIESYKITGLKDIYDNIYIYFAFFIRQKSNHTYLLYKYNETIGKFEKCVYGGINPFGTYRGNTEMFYVPSKKGYLYPASGSGPNNKCLYVEDGEITQKPMSGRVISSSSTMTSLTSKLLTDYNIVGTISGTLLRFQDGSDTAFTGVEKSISNLKDIYNGRAVGYRSSYLYFYSYDENLTNITQLFSYYWNYLQDIVFVSLDTLLAIFYTSNNYYLKLLKVDYANRTVSTIKSILLSSKYNSLSIFWLTDTQILLFAGGTGTYAIVDVSEGILKLVYAEDDSGERYYSYDNASTLEDLSNVLEGSGSVIYKNGLGTGTMPNRGNQTFTPTTSQQTLQTGYYNGAKISAVTSSIDNNIQPSNIKDGVTILGVTGTLKEQALVFSTIEEMEAYENPVEDQYAIIYGTTYIGTYRYDNNNWVQIGDSTQEQEIMNTLNDIMNTTDQYEGNGGTDEQINAVLDDILGEGGI